MDVHENLVKRFDFKLMSIGEKLKKKIDNIALEMINKTNKYESMYLNNLQSKKHSPSLPSFDDTSFRTWKSNCFKIEEIFQWMIFKVAQTSCQF
jgi:hypothetical protein